MSAAPLIDIVRDAAALRALAPAWADLWRGDARATPFQTPAWLIAWWEAFAPGSLHVVALREGDALIGLAPFYVEHGERERLLPLGVSISDCLDCLARDDAAAEALMAALLDSAPAPRIDCESLSETAHARRAAVSWRAREETCDVCPALPLGETWDAHVPARKRRQWRRALRAAERRGRMEIVDGAADVDGFLEALERLHGARWQTRDEDGVLVDDRVRAFHRRALPGLAAEGLARLFILRLDGRAVGAYYGMHAKGRAFAYIGGFDPDYAAESPGAILMAHAMQTAHAEGARAYEFLRGDEAYKYAWGAQNAPCLRRILERP